MIRRLLLATLALAGGLSAQSVLEVLGKVENRYNASQTLILDFEQDYTIHGQGRPTERGRLYLSKPGRMRWEYSDPAGKVFVTDAKDSYFYSPRTNRVEKAKLKQVDDFRAPFAFLLGKLDFQREFSRFYSQKEGDSLRVSAVPKSEKFPYKQVQFLVTPDHRIARLEVVGHDESILAFHFDDEKRNARVEDRLFRFSPPPGAQVVEVDQ